MSDRAIPVDGRSYQVDGRAVARRAIPDSVTHQVRREEFADPWPFNIGDTEMAYSGLSTTNGLVDNDGSGRGSADGPQNLPENESFGIAITAGFNSVTSTVYLTGSKDSNADCFVRSGSGEITARFADNDSNVLAVETDSDFDDGTVRPIIINKNSDSASDINIFVGDMETPKATTITQDEPFNHENYSNSVEQGFWDLFFDGSFNDQQMDAMVGCFEFNSEPYDQSDRESFVDRRPEV